MAAVCVCARVHVLGVTLNVLVDAQICGSLSTFLVITRSSPPSSLAPPPNPLETPPLFSHHAEGSGVAFVFSCLFADSLIACQLPWEASVAARAIINTLPPPRPAGTAKHRHLYWQLVLCLFSAYRVCRCACRRRLSSQDSRRRHRFVKKQKNKTSALFSFIGRWENVKALTEAVYQHCHCKQPGDSTAPPAMFKI